MGKRKSSLKTNFGLLSVICTCILGASIPAKAAENVILRYGALDESISLAELQSIADTGKVPQYYKMYTERLPVEKRNKFLQALRLKFPVNFVTLSRFFYTPVGGAILEDFSRLTLRKDNAGMIALRTALVNGSLSSDGLSIISFIKAYPSDSLEIDVEQAFDVFKKLNVAYKQTQQFMEAISPRLSVTQSRQLNLPFDPTLSKAKVEVLNLQLTDQKRNRSVPVDVYFSTATRNQPVVVLSHGFSSNRTDMRYIALHLASYGYVVAAVEHVGSNEDYEVSLTKPGIVQLIQPQEFLDRPKDISFVLDKLAEFNNTANHPLHNLVTTDNATVIGHSFGGATALAIAGGEMQIDYLKSYCRNLKASTDPAEGLQCFAQGLPENRYQLRDSRVKQVIALNPTTSLMFGKTGLNKIQIPTLMLTASADRIAPALTEQIIGFNKIPSQKWLVGIVGATHGSVKDPISTAQREGNNKEEVVGEQAADIRKYVKAISLAFVSQKTSSASEYQVFLTPEYAKYASKKSFSIRLVTEIPPDVMTLVNKAIDDNRQ